MWYADRLFLLLSDDEDGSTQQKKDMTVPEMNSFVVTVCFCDDAPHPFHPPYHVSRKEPLLKNIMARNGTTNDSTYKTLTRNV